MATREAGAAAEDTRRERLRALGGAPVVAVPGPQISMNTCESVADAFSTEV